MGRFVFIAALGVLGFLVLYLDKKRLLLKDSSSAAKKPYSWARVQSAWWTVIVLAAMIAITFSKGIPSLDVSTLVLLGIAFATTGAAKVMELSDAANQTGGRHQDQESGGFIQDILSDENGASVHRFQTVVINLLFGIWFIIKIWHNIPSGSQDAIIPVITNTNLVLLGLSAGSYVGLKSTENKSSQTDGQGKKVP
jgi:hypothetical protein